ncbi:MAG: hypothetical protein J2P17_14695 [Mycobacterium sp.]|nr:hypothetical protein [Mycobacterium sp.]
MRVADGVRSGRAAEQRHRGPGVFDDHTDDHVGRGLDVDGGFGTGSGGFMSVANALRRLREHRLGFGGDGRRGGFDQSGRLKPEVERGGNARFWRLD